MHMCVCCGLFDERKWMDESFLHCVPKWNIIFGLAQLECSLLNNPSLFPSENIKVSE